MYQGQLLGVLQNAVEGLLGRQRQQLLPFLLQLFYTLKSPIFRFVIFHK
jgi:hypothetical protein